VDDEFTIEDGRIIAFDGDAEETHIATADELNELYEALEKVQKVLFAYRFTREDEDRVHEKYGGLASEAVSDAKSVIHELFMAAKFGKDSAFLP
jgi:hypothetical protein